MDFCAGGLPEQSVRDQLRLSLLTTIRQVK